MVSESFSALRSLIHGKSIRRGTAAHVQLVSNSENPIREALQLNSTEPGNNGSPLPDSSRTHVERPSDIRGCLKVINNVLFQHDGHLTPVSSTLQPHSKTTVLTSVAMDKLGTLAERLKSAMGEEISQSDLARECEVSPAAVFKWLSGDTKKLKAETLADAARALGVREEWLRTGKLPRERIGAQEDRQVDEVIDILQDLRGPLSALAIAIEALSKTRAEPQRKRTKP